MPTVYLGLGSNSRPEENLQLCAHELRQRFNVQRFSRVYRNKALGFSGEDFLNAVACVQTPKSPVEVCDELEHIHRLAGRRRGKSAFMSRTLDVDLLLYDDWVENEPPVRVPRDDVLKYAFVLGPLAEIAPDYAHPLTGHTLAFHWSDFAVNQHVLTREELIL